MGLHIHTVSVLNSQKVVSICIVNASSTGRNGLVGECFPGRRSRRTPPISLSRSRCVVAFHSHFYQSTDWHGLLSIPIFSKVGTLDWTCDKKRDLLLWRFCSNQDGSVLDEVWADHSSVYLCQGACLLWASQDLRPEARKAQDPTEGIRRHLKVKEKQVVTGCDNGI